MKRISSINVVAITLFGFFFFLGCEQRLKVKATKEKDDAPQNIKNLQAVDLIGYDGQQLRKTTEGILDTNKKHNQAIESEVEGQK